MKSPSHRTAVLQALLVTLLWSSSWVLIKIGLKSVPALTFSGLRYVLAFLCLLPFLFRGSDRAALSALSRRDWLRLSLLGVLFITITQGAQFIGLVALPAVTVSLMLNFTSPLVALLGIAFLNERPSWLQWAGLAVFLVGVVLYFSPVGIEPWQAWAAGIAGVGVLANAFSSVLGRAVNRKGNIPPLVVTAVSMGIGSVLLLAAGLAVQGLPPLPLAAWGIIAWLAVVNTAFAFTLWNQTLRTLPAVESSIINGTMLVQIAALAWVFLGESLTTKGILGLAAAAAGAILVQIKLRPKSQPARTGTGVQEGHID